MLSERQAANHSRVLRRLTETGSFLSLRIFFIYEETARSLNTKYSEAAPRMAMSG